MFEAASEEGMFFEPEDGLEGDGEVFDPNEFPEWFPANMRSGAYWMTVQEVLADNSDAPIEDGFSVDVWAPYVGGVILLWGYAPLETDGDILRADGLLEIPHDELDCTTTLETIATGESLSEDTAFFLEVFERAESIGADCESLGITEGVFERSYLAEFDWMEPLEEAEDVNAE